MARTQAPSEDEGMNEWPEHKDSMNQNRLCKTTNPCGWISSLLLSHIFEFCILFFPTFYYHFRILSWFSLSFSSKHLFSIQLEHILWFFLVSPIPLLFNQFLLFIWVIQYYSMRNNILSEYCYGYWGYAVCISSSYHIRSLLIKDLFRIHCGAYVCVAFFPWNFLIILVFHGILLIRLEWGAAEGVDSIMLFSLPHSIFRMNSRGN